MKIAAINDLPTGSPATIMRGILEVAEKELGAETVSLYGNWKGSTKQYMRSERFGFKVENYLSAIIGKYFGLYCYGSFLGTIQLIRKLKMYNPDIIHLHNLHLPCINIPLLFWFIKRNNIKVVWTLHDSWAFTGRCPYFQVTKCTKWENGCYQCQYPRNAYPTALLDLSKLLWKKKKKWFLGINDMTLVTPSRWLADLVKKSFLSKYNVDVINNGIDLTVFKPTTNDFRTNYSIGREKILVLGVAYKWNYYKGIDVFIELSMKLDDSYQIVLVGIDKQVQKVLPNNIIAIERTKNVKELVEIYSAADVLINPTREENYPTVCMECIACGTPVITFDTGGCKEIVDSESGIVAETNSTADIVKALGIIKGYEGRYSNKCIKRSKDFNMHDKYLEYIRVFVDV